MDLVLENGKWTFQSKVYQHLDSFQKRIYEILLERALETGYK